jgi:hypothetical protein
VEETVSPFDVHYIFFNSVNFLKSGMIDLHEPEAPAPQADVPRMP